MNEENEFVEEPLNEEWQEPPLPEEIPVKQKEEAQMSEVSTLINIFFEPGRVFEDLRRKPRFIIGFIIIALLTTGFAFALQSKLGEEKIKRFTVQQAEKSPQFANATPEQKEQGIKFSLIIQKVVTYSLPIILFLSVLIGALLYWLGSKAMGGDMSFLGSISVWVYSLFPVTLIAMIANFIILLLKSADDIDIANSQRGLVKANPTMFIDGKEMPVIATLLSTVDVFVIWGWILAAIGISKVAKLSTGSAWGVVLIFALIGITGRVLLSLLNGVPM